MQKGKSSESAEVITVMRAIESNKPENSRVIDDPYAKFLIGDKWKKLINKPFRLWILKQLARFIRPGFRNTIIARIRFMNECIKNCFPGDFTQLVILGAGYDMSAYCFRSRLNNARVFEVDHPDTQNDKLDKIKVQVKDSVDNITYVPVNFETDDLLESLTASGYSPQEKTLFIWEGVIYYLEKESVEQTLAFIVDNSAKGSQLAFDYLPPEVIDGTTSDRLGRRMQKDLEKRGEPFKFGIAAQEIGNFLEKHRFSDIQKYSSTEIRDAHFYGNNRKRNVSCLFNFVCATT